MQLPNTRTLASLLLLLAMLLAAAGCEALGFVASLGGEKVKAVYELPVRTTLVVVDDPTQQFSSPVLSGVVAYNFNFHLEQNILKPDAKQAKPLVVSQRVLAAIRAELDDEYASTPIDTLGKLAEAEQVIYVLIESAKLQTAPNVYRPTALARVKVIDVAKGTRLFPQPRPFPDPAAPPPGHPVRVQMSASTGDPNGRGLDAMLAHGLAEQLGQQIAQVFYEHKKPEPGHTLK